MTYELITLLFLHWVADFLLQTDKMAINKSKDPHWLIFHVMVYCVPFFCGFFFFAVQPVVTFILITFMCHSFTDLITSNISARFWQKNDRYNFFVIVGFDQFLHVVQLIFTYDYVMSP